ncbi:Crp/Fnr family transcriptional regulator [Prosthecomicrobium sp. N25]|uniref:Crp/Fnr family transcriptional regulator n=1 Tax=Prosthecomicrobium sp. N25 TaxID=3129254 RepID=UPI0030784B86
MAYSERGLAAGGNARPIVSPTSDEGWTDYARSPRVKTNRYEPHQVVFYEGDQADRIYELLEGAVMLYKLLPDGRRQVVEVLGANDMFGLLASRAYDCNAETLTPCVIRVLDRKDAETTPAAQRHITRCLLAQMESMHEHAVLLGRKSAFERVSSFLMRFVPGRGIADCRGPAGAGRDDALIVLTMTRQEIADYLGLTIETVSRVISDLKRRGLIAIEKQDRIRINNVCGMCHQTGAH